MAGHSLESRLRNNLSLKSCKRQSACVNMCTCLRLCLSLCLCSQVLCVCLFGPDPGPLFSRDWALVCLCLCVFLCTLLCCSIKISEYTFQTNTNIYLKQIQIYIQNKYKHVCLCLCVFLCTLLCCSIKISYQCTPLH